MKPHVLVVRLDNAGDVLLAGPAVRAVAAGASRVTLLVSPRGAAAAQMLPGTSHVVVHEAEWIAATPPQVEPISVEWRVAQLRALGVDQAVVLTSFHQSPLPEALLLKLAGVPVVAATCVDYPGSLLDVRHQVPDDVHEVERSLSLVARLGYSLPPDDDGSLRVRAGTDVGEDLADVLPTGDFVVVHPGASMPARTWEPARFAALCTALVARGEQVLVTGGPDEKDLTASVAGSSGAVDLGGRTSLRALAGLLARAGAMVCGNTGPAHLASAVGCPVVSLFAPTVPAVRWRPWRVPHVLLGDQDLACAGCRARNCPKEAHPCLTGVEVDEVLTAIGRIRRKGHR
ncbi:MAG TPA: glycosyltransferase family 9 protein [Acidimicrobiales bacterium]